MCAVLFAHVCESHMPTGAVAIQPGSPTAGQIQHKGRGPAARPPAPATKPRPLPYATTRQRRHRTSRAWLSATGTPRHTTARYPTHGAIHMPASASPATGVAAHRAALHRPATTPPRSEAHRAPQDATPTGLLYSRITYAYTPGGCNPYGVVLSRARHARHARPHRARPRARISIGTVSRPAAPATAVSPFLT